MFERGIFDANELHKGFAVQTKIDCISHIKVDVVDGVLIFTSGDWHSFNELREKLNEVTASMRNVLQQEGKPRYKFSNLT